MEQDIWETDTMVMVNVRLKRTSVEWMQKRSKEHKLDRSTTIRKMLGYAANHMKSEDWA